MEKKFRKSMQEETKQKQILHQVSIGRIAKGCRGKAGPNGLLLAPNDGLINISIVISYKLFRVVHSDTSEETDSKESESEKSESEKSESEKMQTKRRIMPLFTEEEEEKLPIFNHEENPPVSEDSEDDDNFINDEDDSNPETSNSEHSEENDNKSDNSESYINPYLERNNELEHQNIMEILSKSTEKDKSNKKR